MNTYRNFTVLTIHDRINLRKGLDMEGNKALMESFIWHLPYYSFNKNEALGDRFFKVHTNNVFNK